MDPLELELKVVVSLWLLGTELGLNALKLLSHLSSPRTTYYSCEITASWVQWYVHVVPTTWET